MIRHYYYNKQLKKFIVGFANVFAGLRVMGGIDDSGQPIEMEVPVRYGSTDRVVAAIATGNTTNKLHTLPMLSCYMQSLELAPDRMHGVNQVDRRSYLEQGGVFPDDVKAIKRVMAIPYNMEMELAIYASNTDQMFQILEQVLMLFDYDLQLQFNDAPFDWTKISKLILTGMTNEENYPAGTDKRMVMWTLNFELPIWLSPPVEVRNEIVTNISVRIADINSLTLNEVDPEGNLVPFEAPPYSGFSVSGVASGTSPADPGGSQNVTPGGISTPGMASTENVVGQTYDPSLDSSCGKAQNPVNSNLVNK